MMKQVVLSRVAIMGLWLGSLASGVAGYEKDKALLDHVMSPRVAMDLGSTNAWTFADVVKGTKWEDESIKWRTVKVPARHYWDGIWGSDDPAVKTEGYYRRTFELTAEEAARGGALHFELVSIWCDVFINGELVHQNRDLSAPFTVDVTGYLREGTNALWVNVYSRKRDGKDWPVIQGWAESTHFGISAPVHLELFDPQATILSTRIETRVEPSKTLLVETVLTNRTESALSLELAASIAKDGFALKTERVTIPAKESVAVRQEGAWPQAHLWSPADPYLYYAELSLKAGDKVVDALRQRFGFREIAIRGNRITLNGHPFMNRRDSVDLGTTEEEAREKIAMYKARGIVGARVGSQHLSRDAQVCDEEGFLLSVLPPTGGPYKRNDVYFTNTSNLVYNVVTHNRNHPSLIYWGLFNEFGPLYGVNTNQTPKCVEMGEYAQSLDPTRFYCSHGDAEMGITWGGPGACPVRSLHYPVNFQWGGNDFPEIAYWYANGRNSWQGPAPQDKPLMISEDMYHGMNDVPRIMAKWYDDGIYEWQGYVGSWRKALQMLAAGYYYGGVSEWNPWFLNSDQKINRMCDDGYQFMPDYLIATRHDFANVASESEFREKLLVYNQNFAPVKGVLKRRDLFQGKEAFRSETNVEIAPGGRYEGELAFRAPKVKGAAPGAYRVELSLVSGDKTLTTRVYDYNVLATAEAYAMPRKAVLLDYSSVTNPSPVRALFAPNGVFTNASVLAQLKTDRVVMVTGTIPADEGHAIDAWVNRGGRAVALVNNDSAWSPIAYNRLMGHSYAWRRNAAFLSDLPNTIWQVWRPTSVLSVVFSKEVAIDMDVLVDSFHTDGTASPDVVRLPREKGGSWLVTTLPIEECFADEPAASYLARRLMHDQVEHGAESARTRGYAFWKPNHPYEDLFALQGFPAAEKTVQRNPVLLVDASEPLNEAAQQKLLDYAKKGGSVFLTETSPTNQPLLSKLGLGMRARVGELYFKEEVHHLAPWGKRGGYGPETIRFDGSKPFTDAIIESLHTTLATGGVALIDLACEENRPFVDALLREEREVQRDWFTRVGTPQVLSGISNAEWFFSKANLENIFRWEISRNEETAGMGLYNEPQDVSYGVLKPEAGSKAELLLHPGIFAKVPVGKGAVYVLTLKSDDLRGKYPQRFARLWRQMLGNLGVKTSTLTEVRTIRANDRGMGSHVRLWADPETQEPAPVLFEDGDDLRYFPVNQCGWSLQAGNKCPVQPFPREPIQLAGIPFRLKIPNHEKGGASVTLDEAATWPPRGVGRIKRIWLLAALDKEPSDPEVLAGTKPLISTMWHGSKDPEDIMWKYRSHAYYGKDLGAYLKPITPSGNGRIAWEGFSGQAKKAVLYAFPIDNPFKPENGTSMVTIENKCKGDVKLAIFSIAWEEE